MATEAADQVLHFETVSSMSILIAKCHGCGRIHIWGGYQQIPVEKQRVDRERMVCTITDNCRDCGVQVKSEYKLVAR